MRYKPVHDRIDRAPEDGVYRAAHACVAQKSRAAGEDLLVRRLNMRVRTDHSRHFPVEKSAQRNFLASGFAVRIDEDVCCLAAHLRHCRFHSSERVFQNRLHERARLHIDHADFALGRFQQN